MGAQKIQANYQQLGQIYDKFRQQADCAQNATKQIKGGVDQLRNSWTGDGAKSFLNEMDNEIFPALTRLQQALIRGAEDIKKIGETLHTAEEEAQNLFNQI